MLPCLLSAARISRSRSSERGRMPVANEPSCSAPATPFHRDSQAARLKAATHQARTVSIDSSTAPWSEVTRFSLRPSLHAQQAASPAVTNRARSSPATGQYPLAQFLRDGPPSSASSALASDTAAKVQHCSRQAGAMRRLLHGGAAPRGMQERREPSAPEDSFLPIAALSAESSGSRRLATSMASAAISMPVQWSTASASTQRAPLTPRCGMLALALLDEEDEAGGDAHAAGSPPST